MASTQQNFKMAGRKRKHTHGHETLKPYHTKNKLNLRKLVIIPLGRFKGLYDTRGFRCYQESCHESRLGNCNYCKYLPYISSPLGNKTYYCENIDIRDTKLRDTKTRDTSYVQDFFEHNLILLITDVLSEVQVIQSEEPISSDESNYYK